MCFCTSQVAVAGESNKDLREKSHLENQLYVQEAIETLRYSSGRRVVEITFDLLVHNRGEVALPLTITHPDNVTATLATHDWLTRDDAQSEIVSQIYGDCWNIDWQASHGEGFLEYCDPIKGSHQKSRWRALTTGYVDDSVLPEVVFENRPLRSFPDEVRTVMSNPKDFLPFTRFQLGPIPPREKVFARIRVEIAEDAYDRLVASNPKSRFWVIGPDKIVQRIENFELNIFRSRSPQLYDAYQRDFVDLVQNGRITPAAYRVILLQSQDPGDRVVAFRPYCSNISEFYIADDEAREKALWFNAWSQDFSLALRYTDQSSRGGRRSFCRRIPAGSTAV